VLDAILLTGAVAGLIDLVVGGQITSARRSVLGLLVPGLVGLAGNQLLDRALHRAAVGKVEDFPQRGLRRGTFFRPVGGRLSFLPSHQRYSTRRTLLAGHCMSSG